MKAWSNGRVFGWRLKGRWFNPAVGRQIFAFFLAFVSVCNDFYVLGPLETLLAQRRQFFLMVVGSNPAYGRLFLYLVSLCKDFVMLKL